MREERMIQIFKLEDLQPWKTIMYPQNWDELAAIQQIREGARMESQGSSKRLTGSVRTSIKSASILISKLAWSSSALKYWTLLVSLRPKKAIVSILFSQNFTKRNTSQTNTWISSKSKVAGTRKTSNNSSKTKTTFWSRITRIWMAKARHVLISPTSCFKYGSGSIKSSNRPFLNSSRLAEAQVLLTVLLKEARHQPRTGII